MRLIFADLEKIDFFSTIENIRVMESLEQLTTVVNEETTVVLADSKELLKSLGESGSDVYIPFTLLTAEHERLGYWVYFDLETYSFYKKFSEMISKENKPKGVLRFRRIVKQDDNSSLLVGDLYVLTSLLGQPQDIHVKQTNHSVKPSHTIIMIRFNGGAMAHIEYTVANHERIELEWSGMKTIIEIDSDQIRPLQHMKKANSSLRYSVDDILTSSWKVNKELINRLTYWRELINGGAKV